MAAVQDAHALQVRVYELAYGGKLTELRALLEDHPEVDVDGYKDGYLQRALYWACANGHNECARLLIDHGANVKMLKYGDLSVLHATAKQGNLSCVKLLVQNGADVNCEDDYGKTPLMASAGTGNLTATQYLLEQKADIHYRVDEEHSTYNDVDALHFAMQPHATRKTPGTAFAVLSCNTDAKNVLIDEILSLETRDTHIEEYKLVQAYIDEYHRILNLVLSDHVQVDTRVGRGDYGIYQEPLERTLEYLGLSMSNEQVVNTSIDGEEDVKRALIPGHLLNASHWFDLKRKQALRDEMRVDTEKKEKFLNELYEKQKSLKADLSKLQAEIVFYSD
jgi:hypothetical protein